MLLKVRIFPLFEPEIVAVSAREALATPRTNAIPAAASAETPSTPFSTPLLTPTSREGVYDDAVIASASGWVASRIVCHSGNVLQAGPFPERSDAERLRIRSGSGSYKPLAPEASEKGWEIFLSFSGPENTGNAPILVTVTEGPDLAVTLKKIRR